MKDVEEGVVYVNVEAMMKLWDSNPHMTTEEFGKLVDDMLGVVRDKHGIKSINGVEVKR